MSYLKNSVEKSNYIVSISSAVIAVAFFVGVLFVVTLPIANGDFHYFLAVWIESLDTVGLSGTLSGRVANYTAPYIVILGGVNAALPTAPSLTIMHATGLVLHVCLALVLLAAALVIGTKRCVPVVIMMAALAPTSLVNSIVWGQSDAFFTCFVLLAFIAAMAQRWIMSFILLSVAISIKLIALFALPAFFVILSLRRSHIRFVWFPFILVGVYLVLNLPYLLSGVSLIEVATIYLDQANTYTLLSLNAPNPWYLVQLHPATATIVEANRERLIIFGIAVGALVAVITALAGLRIKSNNLTAADQLWLLTVSAMIFPYILPKMHDRYFFLGDICAWLLAMIDRRYLLPALLAQAGSLSAYTGFLSFTHPVLPLPVHYMISVGAILMGAAIAALISSGLRTGTVSRLGFRAASQLTESPGIPKAGRF